MVWSCCSTSMTSSWGTFSDKRIQRRLLSCSVSNKRLAARRLQQVRQSPKLIFAKFLISANCCRRNTTFSTTASHRPAKIQLTVILASAYFIHNNSTRSWKQVPHQVLETDTAPGPWNLFSRDPDRQKPSHSSQSIKTSFAIVRVSSWDSSREQCRNRGGILTPRVLFRDVANCHKRLNSINEVLCLTLSFGLKHKSS